jgi:hypothetical protein
MTIHHAGVGRKHVAWLEVNGERTWEAEGTTEANAIFNLLYALTQRDDPKAKPAFKIVEH